MSPWASTKYSTAASPNYIFSVSEVISAKTHQEFLHCATVQRFVLNSVRYWFQGSAES